MENITMRKVEISKILAWFGGIVLIISLIDLAGIIFPLRLSSPEWVYATTQGVITSILVPILSIVLLLCGSYFSSSSPNSKAILIGEKIVAIFTLILSLALFTNLVVFSLSLKAYETKVVSSIQSQQESVLTQLENIKKAPNFNIPENVYNNKVLEIKKAAEAQIKESKKSLLLKNIKSIAELLLYSIVSLIIGLIAFASAKLYSNKLKFANK
jgi:hypothetical protein